MECEQQPTDQPAERKRGRPKGSKNRVRYTIPRYANGNRVLKKANPLSNASVNKINPQSSVMKPQCPSSPTASEHLQHLNLMRKPNPEQFTFLPEHLTASLDQFAASLERLASGPERLTSGPIAILAEKSNLPPTFSEWSSSNSSPKSNSERSSFDSSMKSSWERTPSNPLMKNSSDRTSFNSANSLTSRADREILIKVNSLSDLVNKQVAQFDEIRKRLDSVEARLSSEPAATGRPVTGAQANGNSNSHSRVVNFDPDNQRLVLEVTEKLSDFNYMKWSSSIESQLESVNLHHFLPNTPRPDQRAMQFDDLVKESILKTITQQAKAKISAYSFPHTKQLWVITRKLFYEDLLGRVEANIAYLTRTDIHTMDEVQEHVDRFRVAAAELRAVDHVLGENVLIKLFLNSLTKLKVFHSVLRKQIRDLGLDYERSLKHAKEQCDYFIRMLDSRDSDDSETTLLDGD